MSWRELMKIDTPTQYPHNPQKESKEDSFGGIEDIEHRYKNEKEPQPIKALGYGCAGCGNRIYEMVQEWEISELPVSSPWKHEHTPVIHWQCESCKTIYEIIGGSKGPVLIQ